MLGFSVGLYSMVKFVPTIVLINPFSALFGPYYFPFFDAMSHQWTERRLRGSYTDPIKTTVSFFVRIVFFLLCARNLGSRGTIQ